jgi:hypothetical protein
MSVSRRNFNLRLAAWALIGVAFIGIMIDVARHPASHTTMPVYRLASTRWWQGHDPYTHDPHAGFVYFPQAAVLFTPFNVVPFFVGEFAWRAFTLGLFAYALVRLNEFFVRPATGRFPGDRAFLYLVLLALPSSLASLRNAQFDLPVAALVVLVAAEVSSRRWTAAAVWLCLAVALKPLAVVPLLLFGALYWSLIPRVVVGLMFVAALPFLNWSPGFVAHEYVRCWQTLIWASKGDEPRYSDLGALLSHFGCEPSQAVKLLLRLVLAPVYLGLAYAGVRRLPAYAAAWSVAALSADYLMLFNARTETCSYVFLGPFVASLALYYSVRSDYKWLSRGLGFAALGLACDGFPQLGTFSIHDMTDRWLKPLLAVFFLPILIRFIFATNSNRDAGDVARRPEGS